MRFNQNLVLSVFINLVALRAELLHTQGIYTAYKNVCERINGVATGDDGDPVSSITTRVSSSND